MSKAVAASKLRAWRENPTQFVGENFGVDPDEWQKEALDLLPDASVQRISMQAAVGVGKSTILAWAGLWFLTCMADKGQHPKGAAVAVTADNLKDNLWPELNKWLSRSPALESTFQWTKERIFAKKHPATWFMSARSFSKTADPEEQGRTLSGLHSEFVLVLVDEGGEIPVAVVKTGDQALGSCRWGKLMMSGNPSSLEGSLYHAAMNPHLWRTIRITGDPDDPKRSPRVDIDWAREQIKTYGRDNPWVMYSILGLFPPSSINSLLGPDEVRASMERHLREDVYNWSQKRIGVDVARFGDDRTIIFPRQGLAAFKPVEMRGARTPDIAARVMQAKKSWRSEAEYVDGTGGFGSGVIDNLIQAGYSPFEIHFSSKAIDPRYFNKRSEMHFLMSEWVKRGGALPNIPGLARELTAPTYTLQGGKLRVEEKEQIKKRLGLSPDYADALALTFAHPDMPAMDSLQGRVEELRRKQASADYDPIARFDKEIQGQSERTSNNHVFDYDPLSRIK